MKGWKIWIAERMEEIMEPGIIEVEWLKEAEITQETRDVTEQKTPAGRAGTAGDISREKWTESGQKEPAKELSKEPGFTQVREGGRVYLRCAGEALCSDEEAMLTDNSPEGLLPITRKCVNGQTQLSYDITGKQSLSGCYGKREIAYDELCAMLLSVHGCLNRMEEYLLSDDGLVFCPAYVYANMAGRQLYFVYLPMQYGGFAEHIREFAQFLTEHVEYGDERAAALAGQFYQYTEIENFNMAVFLEENRAYFEGMDMQKGGGVQEDDVSHDERQEREDEGSQRGGMGQQGEQGTGKQSVRIGVMIAAAVLFAVWPLPWNAQTRILAGIFTGIAAGMGVWYFGWAKRMLEKKERELFFISAHSRSDDTPSSTD